MSNRTWVLVLVLSAISCGKKDQAPSDTDTTNAAVIPFRASFGADDVECGPTYTGAGTSAASFELVDLGFYVYDVTLIRENGETEVVTFVGDDTYQRDRVARIDFADASGKCGGDEAINTDLIVTAPAHDDYTGIRFGLGVPGELNHLDATRASSPLNTPSTWWAWKGGYRFFQLGIQTEDHESFVVHLGSTSCEGEVETGFDCANDHGITIQLDEFEYGTDGIVVNIANVLATLDLNAPIDFDVGDFIAGCMSFESDPECDPAYVQFGRHFLSDEGASTQVVFERDPGAAPTPGDLSHDETPQPGDDDFTRSSDLDVDNISAHGGTRSHPVGDTLVIGDMEYNRGPGSQCVQCHQENGPGKGLFQIAGSIFSADATTPYANATVKILPASAPPCADWGDERDHCAGQPGGTFLDEDVVAVLEVDGNGNFFTTDLSADAEPPFWPIAVPAEGDTESAIHWMGHAAGNGSCNMCHGGSHIAMTPPEDPW